MKRNDWQLNIWTGNSHLWLAENQRICRLAGGAPYLYRAEYWGDYSPEYPKNGPWRKSLGKAKLDAKVLARNAEGDER